VSKPEIIDINQLDNNVIELFWTNNENFQTNIQIQYRLIAPKTSWLTDNKLYNHSITNGIISNLEPNQAYKFRLITFDLHGKQQIISSTKRFTLKFLKNQFNLPIPQITDAWITTDGQISLKWKVNDSNSEIIDGFIIYYRLINSNRNYTKITIPNLLYPIIDTYTISSIEANQKYELRMATYSNRGLSSMSNSIEISIPLSKKKTIFKLNKKEKIIFVFFLVSTQRRSNMNQKNLDEILENITKVQNPTRILHDLATPDLPSVSGQKNSDILYLTIGIIAGILLILIIILIVMCILRILQRKKFIGIFFHIN
jgi:hypothetical protein